MGVFYINGVNSMPFVKKCENTLDKTTRKHRRGEAAYSSVSVMDDAAKDALSQVKLPMTNHHG